MTNRVIAYCKTIQKPIPRPAIELSKVMDFNDTVTMDLHQLGEKLWYLHFIDKCFKSNATIIKSKYPSLAIKCF